MSMQAPRAVLHSSASAPRFLDTFGTSSTRLQHLPRGLRAFLICSASLRDVRNASGPSAHFPDAFTKFRDTVCSAEAFGTTHRRCRRFPEGADVVTMSRRQHGQDAEGVRKFISASKFCTRSISMHKLFDVQNLRKYPEGFRND